MQSALRSAARRAAGAASRRGVATTTTGAEREWLASQVRLEVRAQMLAVAAEEKAALQRAMEAERAARRRVTELELQARWKELSPRREGCWMPWMGFWEGYITGFAVAAVGMWLAAK